jgi:hypothetical protein
MPANNAIIASVFCRVNNIDYTFIERLEQNGLIQTNVQSGNVYIPEEQLPELEKIIRLYYDMDINIEGIETIRYLVQKIETLHDEMIQLKNRLSLYESLQEQATDAG